jgi:hypothetical protein
MLVSYWNTIGLRTRKIFGTILISTAAVALIGSALLVFGYEIGGTVGNFLTSIHHSVELAFNKDRMPITRILLGTICFWAFFWIIRTHEQAIMKRVGWFFLPLGENSLYVYTIQAFIVFFAHLFILNEAGSDNMLLNTVLSVLALTLVWFLVRKKFLMKIIPR